MNRTYRTTAAVLAAALLLTGCSLVAGGPSMAEGEAEKQEKGPATAAVTNDSWFNLQVYVADDTRRDLLGNVPSYETTTFEIPRSIAAASGEIQLVADPVGATNEYLSAPVLIGPGQVVEWTVQNDAGFTYNSIVVR